MHKLFLGLALVILISTASFPERAIAGNATPYPGTEVIATKYSFGQLRTRLEAAIEKSGMYVVTSASASAGAKHRGIKIPGNLVLGVCISLVGGKLGCVRPFVMLAWLLEKLACCVKLGSGDFSVF